MAKLNRERKLVEKRHAKQIKKDARRAAAAEGATAEGITDGPVPAEDALAGDRSPA